MAVSSTFPIYKNPPVAETVFSVQFEGLPAQSVRLSQYWPKVRNRFPNIGVAPPLPTVFEPQYLTPSFQPLSVSFDQDNRVILEGDDHLLQIQSNRFLFNWRRSSPSTSYPGFEVNFPRFKDEFDGFRSFAKSDGIGEIQGFNQFELTYVNIFDIQQKPDGFDFSGIFRDHYLSDSGDRYLPAPELLNWSSSYKMQGDFGRLHVSSNAVFSVVGNNPKIQMRVELTARGPTAANPIVGFDEWFNEAHSHVVKGFEDLIDADFQRTTLGRVT
jgi:uncharacterized protein (TIGR04255 family)